MAYEGVAVHFSAPCPVHPLLKRWPGAASIEKVLACVEICEAGALPDGPAHEQRTLRRPL